jgi:lipid A 4'-phosphatase
MSYLRLWRGRLILACFAVTSLILAAFPAIDIGVSKMFFDEGFHLSDRWWPKFLHDGIGWFIGASLAVVVALYACNRLSKRNFFQVDGKRVAYLFIVLFLGAGLIVNVVFKDNFGRARPRDIAEFGGHKQFTPAFTIGTECRKNCSFSSGEAAGGFFTLALALALSRRRRALALAVAVGAVVSFWRIAAGAHFLSDTIVSFFVMLIVADVLHHYIVLTRPERVQGPALAPLKPKYAAAQSALR